MSTTTKLRACPRCLTGALDLTQQEPTCYQCGWADYSAQTPQDRRTATKRQRARSGTGRGYRLPHRGRSGPQGSVSVSVVFTDSASFPLCPWCLERMAPSWAPNTPPTAKAYLCKTGHGIRVHRNKFGEDESWTVVPGSAKLAGE